MQKYRGGVRIWALVIEFKAPVGSSTPHHIKGAQISIIRAQVNQTHLHCVHPEMVVCGPDTAATKLNPLA